MVIDLKTFLEDALDSTPHHAQVSAFDLVSFLQNNEWFGSKPIYEDGRVILDEKQILSFTPPLQTFIQHFGQINYLVDQLQSKFPTTFEYAEKYFDEENLLDETRFFLFDFLLANLNKDIYLYSDHDLIDLISAATMDLTKEHGDLLTFFLAWMRANCKTRYYKDYTMNTRYTMTIQNQAYSMDDYLMLMYYLLNEDYIADNNMYALATESQDYTDTWLYLSMHFICSLRLPDLERIYHPDLMYPPATVLEMIKDDSFSDNDARLVLLSITTRMSVLPFNPNKTSGTSGVASVKIVFPDSCEVHFGKLFALAEAHRQLAGNRDTPIIRRISTYKEISRYMGDEIGNLFLESDFRSRSATKSYLQSIYMCADKMTDDDDGLGIPNMKGYLLAAMARSHKGSYGSFAETTFTYLKDAKLNGLTPEIIAFELLERGVLSFIPDMLLKMVGGDKYKKLSVSNQTKMIQTLGLSPATVESIVSVVAKVEKEAEMVVKDTISSDDDVLTVLHRIGSGAAFSKQPECLCLLTALGRTCLHPEKRQCVGCKYEISTKSTMFLLISELNRLNSLYQTVSTPLEKTKYQTLITTILLPKMDEMLCIIKDHYGIEVAAQYHKMIEEYVR